MMEMQSSIKASDSTEVKRQNVATGAVFAHDSMMLSLGQAQVPGLRNINHAHRLKQVDKQGKVRVIKNTMAGVLDCLRWNEERVFQRIWDKKDGTALIFFSNVIQDVQTYVNSSMTCPAPNIHWFLDHERMRQKGCRQHAEEIF